MFGKEHVQRLIRNGIRGMVFGAGRMCTEIGLERETVERFLEQAGYVQRSAVGAK